MQFLIYFGKGLNENHFEKITISFRNMFAENILQAAIEQVKTTRG